MSNASYLDDFPDFPGGEPFPDTPFQQFLAAQQACLNGRRMVGAQTIEAAWASCVIPGYMAWLLEVTDRVQCTCDLHDGGSCEIVQIENDMSSDELRAAYGTPHLMVQMTESGSRLYVEWEAPVPTPAPEV